MLTHGHDPLRLTQAPTEEATYAGQPQHHGPLLSLRDDFMSTLDWIPFVFPSTVVALEKWISKKWNCWLNEVLFQSVNKPEFVEVGHVCAEKYKMDFICRDLKLYVVLPVLQHKTFIINLWIELL